MDSELGMFGNVLNHDLTHGVDFGTGLVNFAPGGSIVGNVLEHDFSGAHILEDPYLKNLNGNHHILTHDMTLLRNRIYFSLKFFFADVFKKRRPKMAGEEFALMLIFVTFPNLYK